MPDQTTLIPLDLHLADVLDKGDLQNVETVNCSLQPSLKPLCIGDELKISRDNMKNLQQKDEI